MPNLDEIAQEAQEAFWEIVSRRLKLASGDFPPDATTAFDAACLTAVSTLYDWNKPKDTNDD